MSTVSQIYEAINELAPFSLTMSFDNTGILVGDRTRTIKKALLALDCTMDVLEEAKKIGAELIITHHPIIFHPMKRINEDSVVYHLIRNDIAVISAHTNLDIAEGGVNDALSEAIGLKNCAGLEALENGYLGRVGRLSETFTAKKFAVKVKEALHASSIKFADAGNPIQKIALCSGSGGDCIEAACACKADALLTADVKHNQFIDAVAAGISIFDAGHFDTEDVVIEPLKEYLHQKINDVEFVTTHISSIAAI